VTWEQESKLPALPQTCPTCGAHFKQLEADALREHQDLCASWTTRVPLSDGHGNALGMLGDPNATRLARHIQVYDRGGATAKTIPNNPRILRRSRSRSREFYNADPRRLNKPPRGKAAGRRCRRRACMGRSHRARSEDERRDHRDFVHRDTNSPAGTGGCQTVGPPISW
jgi:hypothetical protein